jgi:2-polyprenyl-3-methyl-5-hydroxy-6-metoxy-1,4-benzoquinol methylase
MMCEVCGNAGMETFLELGAHPLCDDLIDPQSPHDSELFRQTILLCEVCLTAHQGFPVQKETLFNPNYHYRSRLTNDVLSGMQDLVKSALEMKPPAEGDRVLDIGCNDGSLLGMFKEAGLITFGVDPTRAVLEHDGSIDHAFMEFFTPDFANRLLGKFGTFQYITMTNVFAHIEDFQSLCEALDVLIGPDTLVVIENHYLGSILEKSQFDTFYHEHPRTYSARSFKFVSERLQCPIVDLTLPKRYGGNIRVSMSSSSDMGSPKPLFPDENWMPMAMKALQKVYESWKLGARRSLHEIGLGGKVAGKALPGRAVMLISALGLTSEEMPEIFEKPGSPKVGLMVPGTDIIISSDEKLIEGEYTDLVVWAWHISDEVSLYLRDLGFTGRIWKPMPTFEIVSPE